jgi:hypothetical protein
MQKLRLGAPLVFALAANTGLITAPSAAEAPEAERPRLDEHTALTIEKHQVKLGVLSFDYGILDGLSVGTDPPAWAARATLSVVVPNLHLKAALVRRERFWITGQVAAYYASLTKSDSAEGSLVALPLSLFGSFYVRPRIGLHGEATYNVVTAFGTGDISRASVSGGAVGRTFQIGAMGEYRLSRVVAFTLRGRVQAYTGPVAFNADSGVGGNSRVTIDARQTPADAHPWMVVAGATFLWKHVYLSAGVGYGNYFLPGIDIAVPGYTIVPDGSLSFVF